MSKVTYFLDGTNFKEYGVSVSASKGVINRPKLKNPTSASWDNYHGEVVDLEHKYYEPREITLSCFCKAENKIDFITKTFNFQRLFDKKGTQRLMIDFGNTQLVYEVYCKDAIEITKKWNDSTMVGTFDLKLIEPEPIKKVLKYKRTNEASKRCSITLNSSKLVNIYWGDGSTDFDVEGSITRTHDYLANGTYHIIITGDIDTITNFSSNAEVLWNKL
ncbi:phage tail family protein [Capnocytophaga canimorsus]|nr:phage tail domain-containing protein [Capnocytophaga canimorsus]WGU68256.1 phage tail family protein [Capnocytophaga canimorsus]